MRSTKKTYVAELPDGSYRVAAKSASAQLREASSETDRRLNDACDDDLIWSDCAAITATMRQTLAGHGIVEGSDSLLNTLARDACDAFIALGWRPPQTIVTGGTAGSARTPAVDWRALESKLAGYNFELEEADALSRKKVFQLSSEAMVLLVRGVFPTADSVDVVKEDEHPVYERGYYVQAVRDTENNVLWDRDLSRDNDGPFVYWLGNYSLGLHYGPDGWISFLVDEPGSLNPDHPDFGPPTYRRAFVFPTAI